MYYNKFTNDKDILTHPNFYQKVYKKNNKPPRIINMKTYYQKKTTKKLSYNNNNINTKKYYENDDEYYFKKIKNSRILKKDSFEEKSTFYKSTLSNNYSTTSLENNNLSICSTILKTDESKNSIFKEEKNINKNFNFSSTQPIQNTINQSQIISNNQNNQNLCNPQLFSIKYSPNPILENTEILSINVKISENKFSTFKLRRYDDLFITVKLFCEINKIDEKLIKPIIIKVLSCLNCIYKIMNCNLLNGDINILKEIKRTNY
jgi:hypothetical protein